MRRGPVAAAVAVSLLVPIVAVAASRGDRDRAPAAAPSFQRDVAPILREKCTGCHQLGGIAPFSLQTAKQASKWAQAIGAAVDARVMPPWPPGPASPEYVGEETRKLTVQQRSTLVRWARSGGKASGSVGKPSVVKTDVRSGERLLTLAMPTTYTPKAKTGNTDDYRCFLLDPKLSEDAYATSASIRPLARSVVHHVILFRIPAGAATEAKALDGASAGAGWSCFGGIGVSSSQALESAPWISAWAPGWGSGRLPDGTGVPLPKGSLVVMQVHYNLANGIAPDRSRAVFTLAPPAGLKAMETVLLPAPVELACVKAGDLGGIRERVAGCWERAGMSSFPCLVRSVSASGEARYALGDRLVDRYLDFVAGRCRPNTVRATAFDLKTFFTVVERDPLAVTPVDVFEFLAVQRGDRRVVRISDRESGLSARTIARRLSTVSGFYAYLVARGDTPVVTNPVPRGLATRRPGGSVKSQTVPLVRVPRTLPRILSPLEVDALVGALRSWRDRAMIDAMLLGGLRRCEVLGLRLADIDVADRRVFIVDGKGGHQRWTPMANRFFSSLGRYLREERPVTDTDPVFVALKGARRGQPLSAAGLDEILAGARRRAGLETGTCHQLRHTCLTRLREAGMSLEAVQAQAGHRSIESTRIYLHLTNDWLAEQYQRAATLIDANQAAVAEMLAAQELLAVGR